MKPFISSPPSNGLTAEDPSVVLSSPFFNVHLAEEGGGGGGGVGGVAYGSAAPIQETAA